MGLMRSLECLLLHIPHASTFIPEDIKPQFTINEVELSRELNLMTDHFTDWLMEPVALLPSQKTIAGVSRLVVDVERFSDDSQEIMSEVGMGVIYEKGSQRQAIRSKPNEQQRKALLSQYYFPHHTELIEKTQAALDKHGKVLILDIHSYPSKALPYELDEGQMRPQICIGTDDFHTPLALARSAKQAFEAKSFTCASNTPFAGTLIPSPFWQANKNVMGLMIEIRRDVYMDESTFQLRTDSTPIRSAICEAIIEIVDCMANNK
jgi:N-formylglutamate amidohydrolase